MNNLTNWYEFGGIITAILAGIGTAFYYLINKGKLGMLLKERREVKKQQTVDLPDNCFWNVHTVLHETLTELRVKTNCARAQIVQFHNGGEFLDGISMKKMSLTHESLDKGVSSEMSLKQNLLLSMCVEGLILLLEDDPKIYLVDELEDCWCKQFLESSNVIAFSFLPLKKHGQAVGYVMAQWCSWKHTDDTDEVEVAENIESARNLVEIQLELLKSKKHGKQ
tara:strand:- start:5667 stop:6335 length:669 start_codon:yes stop_codon:yes gene_type:complete